MYRASQKKLQRIFKSHGVPSYHKPYNTIRSLLVRPKDKSEKTKQCGLVYSMTCDNCPAEYVGETARTLGTRYGEHTDGKHPQSAIQGHMENTGHTYSLDNVKVPQDPGVHIHPQETANPQPRPRCRGPPHPPPTTVTWPAESCDQAIFVKDFEIKSKRQIKWVSNYDSWENNKLFC